MDNFCPLSLLMLVFVVKEKTILFDLKISVFQLLINISFGWQVWKTNKPIKYVDDICTIDKNKNIEKSILNQLNAKSIVSVVKNLKVVFKYKPDCF